MLLEFDGTFIFAFLSFIIFVALMNLILYRPVMKVIGEREKLLSDNNDIVQKSNKKADEAKKFHENEILSAKADASKLLYQSKEYLKESRDDRIRIKKEELQKRVEENVSGLLDEKNTAKDALKDEVENYVKMTVLKVLGDTGCVEYDDIKVDKDRIKSLLEAKK